MRYSNSVLLQGFFRREITSPTAFKKKKNNNLGSFSAVPSFKIWGDFPLFRRSTVPAFRVADLQVNRFTPIQRDATLDFFS